MKKGIVQTVSCYTKKTLLPYIFKLLESLICFFQFQAYYYLSLIFS